MIQNLYLNVGAMKAGTTWLFSHLGNHPDIHFSLEKEIHYFAHCDTYHTSLDKTQRVQRLKSYVGSVDAAGVSLLKLREDLAWYDHYVNAPIDDEWYKQLFSGRRSEKFCADFSNLYARLEKPGWDHAKAVAKNLKVTYILRHPLKRLWSHVKFHTRLTGEYDEMLTWDAARMEAFVRKAFIWENAEYSRTVKTLQENLEPYQLKIAFFEDIHENPKAWLRDLETFLDIRHFAFNPDQLSKRVNESRAHDMPALFSELFSPDLQQEIEGVKSLGLTPPESWTREDEPHPAAPAS